MCGYKENRGSLPSYAWSPWKEGRSEEEQRELQEIQEIRIPDGIRELGNYTFYGCRNLMTLEMTDSVKTIGGGSLLLGAVLSPAAAPFGDFICLWNQGEPPVSGMWSVKHSMKSMFPSGFGTAVREQS